MLYRTGTADWSAAAVQELPPLEANSRFLKYSDALSACLPNLKTRFVFSLTTCSGSILPPGSGSNATLYPTPKHLLLIVAYRNNEVSESHPVKMMLDRLYKARIPLTIILLEPLNIHHLTH
jgi:hypothetical protein